MLILSLIVEDIVQYNIFTTLDMKFTYQITISDNNHKYTAFEVNGKLYQFTCLSFGTTYGVSAFQRCIDNIIDREKLLDTFIFVDNITICGKTPEEHNHNLHKFYDVAKKYKITLNNDKSIISATSITLSKRIKYLTTTINSNNFLKCRHRQI